MEEPELFIELKESIPKQKGYQTLDRIYGIIWGCALGDAIGLQFEGCDKRRAQLLIERSNGIISFPSSINGDKIRNIIKGDWTDDTDHMVLLLESSYFDKNNILRVDNKLFASKLILWRHRGFPELGDTCGQGIGSLTANLTAHPKFTIDPHAASVEVYKYLGGTLDKDDNIRAPAPNGALMRIAPLALSKDYMTEIAEHVTSTHFDSRCFASCLLQCKIIRKILRSKDISSEITTDMIREYSKFCASNMSEKFEREFIKYCEIGLISQLIPDKKIFDDLKVGEYSECNHNGYTLVAMAIMIWSVRCAIAGHNYESIIKTIISCGGDADTNASIAGAVLGAYFGYSQLPMSWIKSTPHRDWLDKKIKEFLLNN